MKTLTKDAEQKLADLMACYAMLELTPDEAHALTMAEAVAESANEDRDGDAEAVLEAWEEGSHEAWSNVLACVPNFLTDALDDLGGEAEPTPIEAWLADNPRYSAQEVLIPEQCALVWDTELDVVLHVTMGEDGKANIVPF